MVLDKTNINMTYSIKHDIRTVFCRFCLLTCRLTCPLVVLGLMLVNNYFTNMLDVNEENEEETMQFLARVPPNGLNPTLLSHIWLKNKTHFYCKWSETDFPKMAIISLHFESRYLNAILFKLEAQKWLIFYCIFCLRFLIWLALHLSVNKS